MNKPMLVFTVISQSDAFYGNGTRNLRAGERCHDGVRADSGGALEVRDKPTVVEIKSISPSAGGTLFSRR
jgi:hypothetical protein